MNSSVSSDVHRNGHTSQLLYCNDSIISPSIPSPFSLAGWGLSLLFPFCSFNPCVSTYLFIIVDMIISLHSNGHWIMTFHEDLLNRVLGTEVSKNKGILKRRGKTSSSHSFLIENCCEFIIVLIVQIVTCGRWKHTAT